MRWLKLLGWLLGCVLLLLVAGAAALWFGGAPALVWVLEHPASTIIGRQIRIGGPLTVEWGAPTRIVAEDVHLANAEWGTAPDMFTAQRLEIHLFLRTLLHGPTRIPLVALSGAKLQLETSPQGERNWNFTGNAAAPKKRREFPVLQHFTVADGDLVYRNGATKAQSELAIRKLQLDAPEPASPVALAVEGGFQKLPFRIAGKVGALAELRDPSHPYPVKFEGALDQVDLAVDGTIEEPLDVAGLDLRLSLSGRKFDVLGTALGIPLPALPDFRGTSVLHGGNGKWRIEAVSLALGSSNLAGGIAVDTTAKVPYVEAHLTSSAVDLADFKGLYGGEPSAPRGGPAPAGARVLPDTPIAVHKLPGLNADVTFDGARIVAAGGLPFERVVLALHLKDGEIALAPLRFHIAQGDVDLGLHFNPFTRDRPPHLDGSIDLRHIDLHQLLGGPNMPDMVRQTGGTVGGFVKLDTDGVSLREFLAHMNGDAGVFVENGQVSHLLQKLAPIDVVEALGVYLTGDSPLPVNCFVSRFQIQKGIATATTLLLDTPLTIVTGAGNVNFESETLSLTLTPYNKGFAPLSLRTPVDITGTFAKPEFHPHTGRIIARLATLLAPPAALLALVDTGLGEHNACSAAYAAQQPPGNATPKSGSSVPPAANPPSGKGTSQKRMQSK